MQITKGKIHHIIGPKLFTQGKYCTNSIYVSMNSWRNTRFGTSVLLWWKKWRTSCPIH